MTDVWLIQPPLYYWFSLMRALTQGPYSVCCVCHSVPYCIFLSDKSVVHAYFFLTKVCEILGKCLEHSRRNFGICFFLCHIKITNSFEWMILIVSKLHSWNIPEQNPWYMWRLPCWVISRRRVTRSMRTMSTKNVNRAVQDRWPLWLFRLDITVIIIITVL